MAVTVPRPEFTLPYTVGVAAETEAIHDRLRTVIPDLEWRLFAPYIAAINRLKVERDAVVLAHNYQTPEIFHGVADIVGDSLALARAAAATQASTIVLCGVHFMAETVKLLNPSMRVLIPDPRAGCSLAESITADDVRRLRERYPGVPIVTYVNTSAAVKAESDICCTSGNAKEVIESLGAPRVICLPDRYLAANVAKETKVEIIAWQGACEVHERFTPRDVATLRSIHPGVTVITHPESPPGVVAAADYSGSTAAMIDFIKQERPASVVLLTECSMSDNVAVHFPTTSFLRACNLCPHMKRNSLPKILESLRDLKYPVEVDPAVAAAARRAVERMLEVRTVR
jgi:quinolinate synthase